VDQLRSALVSFCGSKAEEGEAESCKGKWQTVKQPGRANPYGFDLKMIGYTYFDIAEPRIPRTVTMASMEVPGLPPLFIMLGTGILH